MAFDTEYLILAILVFGINIVPAFMPPTWMVLAFFFIKYDLNLLPIVIIGAVFATLGRIVLATLARSYFLPFLPKPSKENLASLGTFLNTNTKVTIPLIITYAFLPIPSNQVYITAGLAKVKLNILAGSFFAGRMISYTFWVGASGFAATSLENIFSNHYSKIGSFAIDILGFIILYFVSKIGWEKILKRLN